MKIFNYDPEVDVPADTACHDYMEFVVEKVLGHAGDTKKPTTMSFHVKWHYDSHNTWERCKSLWLCEALHDYLRDNKMKHFLPKNIETLKWLIPNVLSFEDFSYFSLDGGFMVLVSKNLT